MKYAPRPIRYEGIEALAGWALKVYSIHYAGGSIDRESFSEGIDLAMRELPTPARAQGRPGAGFIIMHEGASAAYLVIAWWDRENELPTRVFVCERDGGSWRAAHGGESFCVWDLQVIAAERDLYVGTVMDGGDLEAGIARYVQSPIGVSTR